MLRRVATENGFTIVEVMIVIAISTFMLVAAIAAMGNKQQTTEFQTSVETLKSEFNQTLSSVADGNYSTINSSINCTAVNGYPKISLGSSSTSNNNCTVIGEVISFDSNSYTVYPVFGLNYVSPTNNRWYHYPQN